MHPTTLGEAEAAANNNDTTTIDYPLAFIAICSVLIDTTYRSDLYQERIWIQLILWMISSLNVYDTVHNQLAGLFAASIASSCFQGSYRIYYWEEMHCDFTRLFALSMLPSILYDVLSPGASLSNENYFYSIFACFLMLSIVMWYNSKRQQRLIANRFLPDESKWLSWTRSDVLYWVSSLDQNWKDTTCPALAPERILGNCLQDLTISDLRSIRIPYGDAQRLVEYIQVRLVSKYPNPRRKQASPNEEEEEDILQTWLGKGSEKHQEVVLSSFQSDPSFLLELNDGENPTTKETIQDRAKSVMKERLGFSLPDLKEQPRPKTWQQPNTVKVKNHDNPIFEQSNTDEPDVNIPNDIISSMPEHIREIASRNPALLQQIWNMKLSGKELDGNCDND